MNRQEAEYFSALTKDRTEIADVLARRAVRGYKNSVVDKYSDQAHFIYELLQNADDAKATNARFTLEENRLIFAHNGRRHFSVTDPANEDEDSENKTLGDINSITSIANSNKSEEKGASIGKFGVGFKAVFQYTETPHIYDPNFRFKIERFIVPIQLDNDFPGRGADETLFVFPFDHPERDAVEAYQDISEKLKNLSFPLLFLSNLKNIEFDFGNVIGLYEKNINQTIDFDGTTAEKLQLTQNAGDEIYDENLWLFSRLDECGRRYSVGFFINKDGSLKPVRETAFCYFPTKEETGLNFILHAPFLLTDSREGIKAGVPHNDKLICHLADLAADSLEYMRKIGDQSEVRLIADNIIDIIPYDKSGFTDPDSKIKVSFMPFYLKIKEKLRDTELIPTRSGYVAPKNAYWAAVAQLTELFSDEQLRDITEDENAHWVFTTLSRDEVQRNNKELSLYIDDIVRTNINEDVVLNGRTRDYYYSSSGRQSLIKVKGISPEFIEKQPVEWLYSFYRWINERKNRRESILSLPIFLDQDGNAVAAYDEDDQLILFLPAEHVEGYRTVNPVLLKNEDTKNLIETIGIKKPSLKDQIYNIILPQYDEENDYEFDEDGNLVEKEVVIDVKLHFKLFFEYYCKCSNDEIDEFLSLIKDCDFLEYSQDGELHRSVANQLYMPSDDLLKYFEAKPGTKFVNYNDLLAIVGPSREKNLNSFLEELGVHTSPATIENDNHGYYHARIERYIDGLIENLSSIEEGYGDLSVYIWNKLCDFAEAGRLSYYVLNVTLKDRPDGRYNFRISYEESSTSHKLKEAQWLLNKDGEFVSPSDILLNELSADYSQETEGAASLISILGFQEPEEDEIDDDNLTDEQREKIAFANKLQSLGIGDEADLEEFREFKRMKEMQRKAAAESRENSSSGKTDIDHLFDDKDAEDGIDEEQQKSRKSAVRNSTQNVLKEIARRTKEISPAEYTETPQVDDTDGDEYMPSKVNYEKKIKRAIEKSAAEIDKITYLKELDAKIESSVLYTYGWFKALLELESINSGEANQNSREVSISFGKVEKELGTARTLVLKHPNRYIPQFMEELADIPLVLHIGDQTKTIAIEVANIKSYTLRVKIKDSSSIEGIDLSLVREATINAQSPAFLLEELRKQFLELGYDDDFNMKDNLCENIEFIFGPPGTGKTTYLAKNVLMPFMRDNAECKVLVLTPTNKAADVLVKRIMEVSGDDHSYDDWLIRFGGTGDEEIEQSNVFKDKAFDIRSLSKNVTVTTIARFPYDFFMPQGTRLFLYALKWEYIVIDEASMIPLANIVFPLYKKTPRKFIIAGDPFQIEPITSVEQWKDENIYKMVELNSFTRPETKPYPYEVKLLTTQYRSVPDIGTIFSNFAYGGILQHYRDTSSQRPLNLGNDIGVDTLNIIKFPVSKYESIYRCKRLQHSSSYQVYSALFTYEYVCFLSRELAKNNPGELFKIGVIAPYRAQADMIDKLLAAESLPKEVDVQVGTIHGFQGDECDIIFAVFNTPPTISSSNQMFLNKRNIINVSISRARDYLFIVMPDDQTENIGNLRLVKRVENLIHSTDVWAEFDSPDLEELMFGDPKYLEKNAFSTSHQSVNVYGLPEQIYEVRTEDAAVDVQVHKGTVINLDSNIEKKTAKDTQIPSEITSVGATNYEDSYDLDETLIPKELRKNAIDLPVRGDIQGWCYLVPYTGKLKEHTIKQTKGMFVPQMRNGHEKMVSVSVVESDRIIYISADMFKLYEQGLSEPEGFEIRANMY